MRHLCSKWHDTQYFMVVHSNLPHGEVAQMRFCNEETLIWSMARVLISVPFILVIEEASTKELASMIVSKLAANDLIPYLVIHHYIYQLKILLLIYFSVVSKNVLLYASICMDVVVSLKNSNLSVKLKHVNNFISRKVKFSRNVS